MAPRHAEAWLEFGVLSAELGDVESLAKARAALAGLDSELIQRLPAASGADDPAGGRPAVIGN
jgi:hypothetical protein